MGKRSRSKSRRQSGAAAAADGDGAAVKVKEQIMVDGDGDGRDQHQPEEDDALLDENNNTVKTAADEDAEEEEPSQTTTTILSKSEKMWNTSQSVLTSNLLPLLSRPQDLLTSLLLADNNDDDDDDDGQSNKQQHVARQQLLSTSQQLFRYIEHLASMEETLKEMQKQKKLREFSNDDDEEEEKIAEDGDDDEEAEAEGSENEEPCGLSGIPSLYTGQTTEHDEEKEEDAIPASVVDLDAETIWGQVDLQNNALLSKLKKSIKKLGKRCGGEEGGKKKYDVDDQVRILNTGAMMGDDEEDNSDEEEDEDMMSMGSAASDFGDEQNEGSDSEEGGDSDEDSEARRIRERMEKAMADMSDDGSKDDEEGGGGGSINEDDERQRRIKELAAKAAALEAEAIDPDREDMRDGFFDLHEMEAFADEEEEMLPNDAYGGEVPEPEDDKKKGKKKTLPHLKDRMGGNDSDSGDDEEGFDEDEDDDALVERFEPTGVRRKKYRADDEVEALYKLYDEEQDDQDDSDDEGSEVDASNMSAADFFGKPDEKLIQSYKNKQKKGKKSKTKVETPKPQKGLLDDDADSWDEHNFEDDGMDWKDKDEEDEEGEDAEEQSDSEEEEEEQEEEVENDEDDGNQKLSAHAIRSKRLEEQTLSIEQDMMAEKPWKMMGEAKGTDRGTDTLLDSTPEFEVAFKPPPILTEEHTTNIEDLIKKRIIDEDWDDVVPRELPDIGLKRGGGDAPEVSQEKSKLGLGELYEREYLKKSTGYDRTADEKQTEEDAAKEEMKELFANLCSQLDALSNYHFAPRPVADEADVKNREDVPAIAMEEVLPLHVSQSRGVAPEEVYAGGKGRESVLKGESEMDQAERKRVRAAKKGARRKERKQKHADEKLISKLQPGLGLNNPYEKRKLREELQMARASGRVVVASDNKAEWRDEAAADKEYQTSTKFFAKMQENVESVMRGDEDGGQDKKKRKGMSAGQGSSAYRL